MRHGDRQILLPLRQSRLRQLTQRLIEGVGGMVDKDAQETPGPRQQVLGQQLGKQRILLRFAQPCRQE